MSDSWLGAWHTPGPHQGFALLPWGELSCVLKAIGLLSLSATVVMAMELSCAEQPHPPTADATPHCMRPQVASTEGSLSKKVNI